MDESIKKEIETSISEAEWRIRNDDFTEAEAILQKLRDHDEYAGRVLFDLGNIAFMQGEDEQAWNFYEESCQNGYKTAFLYQNMAMIQERKQEIRKAENYYRLAIENAEKEEDKKLVITFYMNFYLRQEMYLKAEKVAKQFVASYPDEFQGHHMYFLIMTKKKEYEKIENYFTNIKEQFGREPQYLIDMLANLENQNKYKEELHILETETVYEEVIPEVALNKKAQLLLKRRKYDDVKTIIQKLYIEYESMSGAFSSMLLLMQEGRYTQAGRIANEILSEEKERQGLLYHLTLFLQLFILHMAFEKEVPEEVQKFIEKQAGVCRKWFVENGFDESAVDDALKILV